LVKQKVIGIVCLGEKNKKIHKAFGHIINEIHNSNSAQEAVRISYQLAKKGYSVLLSPACASFDLFENYEERGTKFKKAVRAL
jgi:UDP-N-acetylmuramoylalanine--D-glutamate ligase